MPKRVQAEINYRRNPEMRGRLSNPGFYEELLKSTVFFKVGFAGLLAFAGFFG